jgi:hypothetical protein
MPVPEKYSDELAVEIDKDKLNLWRKARDSAKAWEEEAARLRKEIEETMGSATAATVDGVKVITYRPGNAYAAKRIQEDYPDLAEHFIVRSFVAELDTVQFAAAHPEIAEKYRVRSFREV